MTTADNEKKYPFHFHVWNNEHEKLNELLSQSTKDINVKDPRGRTPLMLAIILGNIESVRVLLRHNANVFCLNQSHWSATQEAVSTGDPEMVKLVLMHRDEQRIREQASLMGKMLTKLKESPDFYVELKWEFSSWLPLISRMCPSDICRVWKSGGNVRIDTTLVGFSGSTDWVRGNISYIFRLREDGTAVMDEIDHQQSCVYRHNLNSVAVDSAQESAIMMFVPPSDDAVAAKLTQPIFATFVDTDKIEFERSKSGGIMGLLWRSEKSETICSRECAVFSASNVQIVTLRRTEHMSTNPAGGASTGGGTNSTLEDEGDKDSSTNPLKSLLKQAEEKCNNTKVSVTETQYNPNQLTFEEYMNPKLQLSERNIGRPKCMTTKVKTFKAHLWLSQEYPLSLQNQILPIIDLMAEFNPHFQKLKDFITMQLPAGFPMKIEIPLYHILTARITFENLFASSQPAECVNLLRDIDNDTPGSSCNLTGTGIEKSREKLHCVVDESIFQLPAHYSIIHEKSPGHGGGLEEEDQLVQMAVQASLAEYGGGKQLSQRKYSLKQRSVESTSGNFNDLGDAELQRAIAASLTINYKQQETANEEVEEVDEEAELARVLELSKTEK